MIKKTFQVRDMHCANCSMRIESIEDVLPGIRQVSASYRKQQMVVEFDETKVSDDQIIAAVRKKGYEAAHLLRPNTISGVQFQRRITEFIDRFF